MLLCIFLFPGTFDIQSVDIARDNELEEYINITCHFAQGSLIKGCRVVITADDKTYEKCELTATREEGSSEALTQVTLPAGYYTVVVCNDEEKVVQNIAHNTTLTVSTSSVNQWIGT